MPSAGRAIRPIWKLEAALKCRSCRKGRYAPPVHMIKLTETREITPYIWVHPDDYDGARPPGPRRAAVDGWKSRISVHRHIPRIWAPTLMRTPWLAARA
jgi:hypothetical protein